MTAKVHGPVTSPKVSINHGHGEHVLNSGQKMLCVKMHKDLSNL